MRRELARLLLGKGMPWAEGPYFYWTNQYTY